MARLYRSWASHAGRDGATLLGALVGRRGSGDALALAAILALARVLLGLAATHALARVDAHALDGGGLLAGRRRRLGVGGLAATGGREQAAGGERDDRSGTHWVLHVDAPLSRLGVRDPLARWVSLRTGTSVTLGRPGSYTGRVSGRQRGVGRNSAVAEPDAGDRPRRGPTCTARSGTPSVRHPPHTADWITRQVKSLRVCGSSRA